MSDKEYTTMSETAPLEETLDTKVKTYRSDLLKLIALVTMLVDHVGVLLFPDEWTFRTIGRIAFPIFAYLLAQGFIYTRDRWRYGMRLLFFALIAELPYTFLNNDMMREAQHYNVMYLLLYGLLCLVIVEKIGHLWKDGKIAKTSGLMVILVALVALPDIFEYYFDAFAFSYSSYGILLMIMFYVFRKKPLWILPIFVAISFFFTYKLGAVYRAAYFSPEMNFFQAFGSFSLIWQQITEYKNGLMTLDGYFFQVRSIMGVVLIVVFGGYYNERLYGKKVLNYLYPPIRLPRWVAYVFYPVHITLLLLLRLYLGGPIQM